MPKAGKSQRLEALTITPYPPFIVFFRGHARRR